MAKTTIQGLTVAIGANTKGFQDAIKEVDRLAKNVATDLKNVSESMKLDPTAIQSYANKFKLLQEAVDTSETKVKLAKAAVDALNKDLQEGKVSPEEYKKAWEALARQLDSAQYEYERNISALRNFDKTTKDATKSIQSGEKAVEASNKTYTAFYEQTSKAADGQKELTENVEQYSKEADDAGKKTIALGDIIKGNLISSAIKTGLQTIANLAKKLARELAEAGKKLLEFSIDAVSYAAQYQDALGYSERVFGGYAEKMTQWIKDNSTALRIGISDLQVYANNLGTAFGALGLGHDQMVEFTQNIISLSADIRAATGKDIDDIMGALTRGFTSSTRNLRQFGVFIGEADIKIQALKDGLIEYTGDQEALNQALEKYAEASKAAEEAMKAYGEESAQFTAAEEAATAAEEELNAILGGQETTLSSSQRTIALYNLIMEKMGFLVGQNSQEAGLYNSQLALLKTQFSNLKLEIGEKLLPVFTDLVTKFNEFLQSDAGQQILNTIVEQFQKWAGTLGEMLEDGSIERFFTNMSEALPGVIEGIGDFTNDIIELVPQLLDLTEKILNFLGIETEASKTKKAYKDIKDEVESLAEVYNTSTETIRTAAAMFAQDNDLTLSQVYADWETYEPKVKEYIEKMKSDYADDLVNGAQSIIAGFASQNKINLNDIYNNWGEYEPKIKAYAASLGSDYDEELNKALGYLQDFADDNGISLGEVLSNFQTYEPQFKTWLDTISGDFDTTEQAVSASLEKMPENAQTSVEKFRNIDYSAIDAFRDRVRSWGDSIVNFCNRVVTAIDNAIHKKKTADDSGLGDLEDMDEGEGGTWTPDEGASFGSVGSLRTYVPSSRSIGSAWSSSTISNNNYSRSVGTVQIFVNSYGMDVAEVADELGAAFANKLRMSGAML